MLSHRTSLTHPHKIQFISKKQLIYQGFRLVQASQLVPQFLGESSPETFSSTKSARQSRIILLSLLSSFSHSSIDIPVSMVPGQTVVHCSQSTRRYSILSFQSSKFWPLNFSISILELLAIL
jgi:hypothetical protein